MELSIGPRQDLARFTLPWRRCCASLFVALAAASGAASAADVFKCRNANGQLAYQSEPCDGDHKTLARWSTAEAKPAIPSAAARVDRPASIAIELSPNGTYHIDGTLNGIPTRFQIDTGASSVSIPSELAYRAGMICRAEGLSNTANGVAKICHSAARQVTFGPFTLEDFPATMLPNLDVPLIGMNALRRLHMEQHDGILTLSF
jgi:clan AA aspartic protease (TIGR02281 family)